jgi:hypothetical protein
MSRPHRLMFAGLSGLLAKNPWAKVARESLGAQVSRGSSLRLSQRQARCRLSATPQIKTCAAQAARWLRLSAKKGDHRAKDGAGADEGWITEMYSSALVQANESDRALAHTCLEEWLKGRL